MILREAIRQVRGFRYMIEQLDICSAVGRRVLDICSAVGRRVLYSKDHGTF